MDRDARTLLDNAQQYYEKTLEELELEKEKMRAEYEKKAAGHLREARGVHEEEAAEQIETIRAQYGQLTRALEARFEQNRQQWVQELVQRCTGR